MLCFQQGQGFFVPEFSRDQIINIMKNFVKNLYNELIEELAIYADLGTLPVRKLTGALAAISAAVSKLQRFITETPFASIDDEIQFFKYDKPAFIAEQFYSMEIFTIETARPLNDLAMLKTFYQQELRYIDRFLEQNKFLFAYYQNDMNVIDHLLFVRGAKPTDIPVPDILGLDPLFNTCCDNLFAKFMAFERLRDYLVNEILELDELPQGLKRGTSHGLKFTGETINLAEVAYGLWLTGQFNDGNASVAEIFRWLEDSLGISIGRSHRRWTEISGRTTLSPTKFIDRIQEAIRERIDEELRLREDKRKSRKNKE